MIRAALTIALACLALGALRGADDGTAAAPAPGAPSATHAASATAAKAVEKDDPLSGLTTEEQWRFAPADDRADPWYDYLVELHIHADAQQDPLNAPNPQAHVEQQDPVVLFRQEKDKIISLLQGHKYSEVVNLADTSLHRAAGLPDQTPEIQKLVVEITGYRDQAQAALVRDEAQAAFDALNLQVEGIMWSESGSRLALITGEPKALGVADRVKDCVIINIDTDRVDFRYHYKRQRFEFPRYVGENKTSK
jgi:hypothetical protein